MLVLQDACYWPGALLQDMLCIASVELWRAALLLPWLWEREHSIPNPIAYIPQYALGYTTHMVQLPHERYYQILVIAYED